MKSSESETGFSQLTAGEVVVVMRDVTMTFDGCLTRVLNAVSLNVRRGEVFGLLGPKGSGKSTALKILAGRLRPFDGKVTAFGGSPRRAWNKARIGYLPQNAGDRSAGWFSWIVELLSSKRQPRAALPLSTTQRRTLLAQVLAKGPELVLLDEPLAGLDPPNCREMKELIFQLAQRGKTVILAGNSLSEAKDVCNRMAILHRGEIQAVGTIAELLATPDAVRVTGPVLPQTTAERVLKIIREDIGRVTPPEEAELQKRAGASPDTRTERSSDEMAAESVLVNLTKGAAPKSPAECQNPSADTVNHDMLAELTKPAAAETQKRNPKNG